MAKEFLGHEQIYSNNANVGLKDGEYHETTSERSGYCSGWAFDC